MPEYVVVLSGEVIVIVPLDATVMVNPVVFTIIAAIVVNPTGGDIVWSVVVSFS